MIRIETEGEVWEALEEALLVWREHWERRTEAAGPSDQLALAIDAATYTPEPPPFLQRLRDELGEGWAVHEKSDNGGNVGWHWITRFNRKGGWWVNPAGDPKRIADALRVLAGQEVG